MNFRTSNSRRVATAAKTTTPKREGRRRDGRSASSRDVRFYVINHLAYVTRNVTRDAKRLKTRACAGSRFVSFPIRTINQRTTCRAADLRDLPASCRRRVRLSGPSEFGFTGRTNEPCRRRKICRLKRHLTPNLPPAAAAHDELLQLQARVPTKVVDQQPVCYDCGDLQRSYSKMHVVRTSKGRMPALEVSTRGCFIAN